jgi:hypothetical protein
MWDVASFYSVESPSLGAPWPGEAWQIVAAKVVKAASSLINASQSRENPPKGQRVFRVVGLA